MGIYTTASYFVLMALTSLAILALPAPTTDNATLQGVFQGWVMLAANKGTVYSFPGRLGRKHPHSNRYTVPGLRIDGKIWAIQAKC